MKVKRIYVVTVETEECVPTNVVKGYIRDALQGWGGGYHPDQYLFGGVKATVKPATPYPDGLYGT